MRFSELGRREILGLADPEGREPEAVPGAGGGRRPRPGEVDSRQSFCQMEGTRRARSSSRGVGSPCLARRRM